MNVRTPVAEQPAEVWAYRRGFSISANEPSMVVRRTFDRGLITPGARVVDLGCGRNPRNALFLAEQGFQVDCVDIARVDMHPTVARRFAGRIACHEASALEFELTAKRYGGAVLARLLQYVPPDELEPLMTRVAHSLVPGGALMLSYTAEGGIHRFAEDYQISTYQHPIEVVSDVLGQSFMDIDITEGARQSTNVPHDALALTYDITAVAN